MKPYFLTHPVGVLYALVLLGWYLMEIGQFVRQRQWRATATRVTPRAYLPAWVACVAVTVATLVAAPHLAPGAAIGHGGAAFAVGMALLVIGVALRAWSFRALGEYFTFGVKVSPDQPVVASGPYRVLRHPGYAGGLLAMIGLGVLYGNWVTLATIAPLWLALIVWRIRVEERALLASLDARYRGYAAGHKRLVPLVW
jgi:protein-S-isoprenylcysteine O-methyltransferase Ste14